MGHGGKRAGAGRRVGSKAKATAEAKQALEALAREHTDVALDALAAVAKSSESDAARVSASVALLDRGYGRPRQQIVGDPDKPIDHRITFTWAK